MRLELRQLAPWIFGSGQLQRFTQDSPVMPDVWMAYGRDPDFSAFYRSLEAYRDSLTTQTGVRGRDQKSEFLRYVRESK